MTERKPDHRRQAAGIREKALELSIEGSEPKKGWKIAVRLRFVRKALQSKITSTFCNFL
jgi:hypothetical protein